MTAASIDANAVKAFLDKHDYVVRVKKTDKDSCEAIFPDKKGCKPLAIAYKLVRETPGVVRQDNLQEEAEFWSSPAAAQRLMVLADVIKNMRERHINESLISYHDETGAMKRGLSELLDGPADAADTEKEAFLGGVLTQAMEEKFPKTYDEVAASHGVATGYRLLKSFFV